MSIVYYSTTVRIYIANKATQKINNKHDHRRYSTPRYMRAVRNNVEVVAEYKRSPRARQPDCHNPAAPARNADYSAFQRIKQARYDTYYEYAAEGLHIPTPY